MEPVCFLPLVEYVGGCGRVPYVTDIEWHVKIQPYCPLIVHVDGPVNQTQLIVRLIRQLHGCLIGILHIKRGYIFLPEDVAELAGVVDIRLQCRISQYFGVWIDMRGAVAEFPIRGIDTYR